MRDFVFVRASSDGDNTLTADEAQAADALWQKHELGYNRAWLKSDPDRYRAIVGDRMERKRLPRAQWPSILTAAELKIPAVVEGFELNFRHPGATPTWCGFNPNEVKSLTVGSISTRDDGQAMHFFTHTATDGKRFLLKLGRYVDMKREALLTERLARCGSTSFAKTCGFFRMPAAMQDDAGFWRRWTWRSGQTVALQLSLIHI